MVYGCTRPVYCYGVLLRIKVVCALFCTLLLKVHLMRQWQVWVVPPQLWNGGGAFQGLDGPQAIQLVPFMKFDRYQNKSWRSVVIAQSPFILELAEQIEDTVAGLKNIDDILNETRDDLRLVQELKARADKARYWPVISIWLKSRKRHTPITDSVPKPLPPFAAPIKS